MNILLFIIPASRGGVEDCDPCYYWDEYELDCLPLPTPTPCEYECDEATNEWKPVWPSACPHKCVNGSWVPETATECEYCCATGGWKEKVPDLCEYKCEGGEWEKVYKIDGCSIPNLLFVHFDDAPTPPNAYEPAPGTATVTYTASEFFEPSCNNHDICYQTCGKPKSSCDGQLGADDLAQCDDAKYEFYEISEHGDVLYKHCRFAGAELKLGVKLFGMPYYKEDQKCCKPGPCVNE